MKTFNTQELMSAMVDKVDACGQNYDATINLARLLMCKPGEIVETGWVHQLPEGWFEQIVLISRNKTSIRYKKELCAYNGTVTQSNKVILTPSIFGKDVFPTKYRVVGNMIEFY